MKRSIFLMLIIFALSINIASAAIVANSTSINFGEIRWGDLVTETFIVNNTGGSAVTNINVSSTANPSNYTVTFSPSTFDLNAGESKTITVELELLKENYRNEGGNKTAGYITIDGANTIQMTLVAAPRLNIKSVDAKVGSNSVSDIEDGELLVKKANPGDDFEVSVEVENLFHADNEKYDIENIDVKAEIIGIDDGNDVEGETDEFMLVAGDRKTSTIKLSIPDMVKANIYDVVITVEGKNAETSKSYSSEFNLRLEIEKRANEVIAKQYALSPAVLACGDAKTTIHIELINRGKSSEDQVAFEIKSPNLNLNKKVTGISMGKDYEDDVRYQKDILLEIEKEFATEGSYPITINVYYDEDKLIDQKITNLDIQGCETGTIQNDTVIEPIVEEQGNIEPVDRSEAIEEPVKSQEGITFITQIPSVLYANTKEFRSSPFYFPLLIFLIVIGSFVLVKQIILMIRNEL